MGLDGFTAFTSVCCKLMESVIHDCMTHMIKYKLFFDKQHGFVPAGAADNELLNQGFLVDAIYLDFKKAFDAVPHERLLLKDGLYGI